MDRALDSLRERDLGKASTEQGLYRKYEVNRTDGGDQPGMKHHGCEYFVLDLDHDPAARPALAAYAQAIRATHPQLADDLIERYGLPEDGTEAVADTLRTLLAERDHRTDGGLQALAGRCLHLSRGDRDLIAMRGRLIEELERKEPPVPSTPSDYCRVMGCVHMQFGSPTWPEGSNPFASSAPVVDDAIKAAAIRCARRAYGFWRGGSNGSWEALEYFDGGYVGRERDAAMYEAEIRAALSGVSAPVGVDIRMTDCTDDAAVRRAVCAYDAWMAEHHPEKDDAYHDGMREAVKAALYCHQEKL